MKIMEKEIVYRQINDLINNSQKILLLTHRRPDGDGLGALCVFFSYLKNLKKISSAYCIDQPNCSFNFLDGFKEIKFDRKITDFKQFDLIICLDCGDLDQTGLKEELASIKSAIINIDHHLTNTYFGNINLIDINASSTTEIIADFFDFFEFKISKNQATCLLIGILTDTDNFSNSATTQKAFSLAAKLLLKGINFKKLYAFGNKNITILKLWGEILSRLEKNENYNIATTVITNKDFTKYNIKEEEFAGMANFFNNLAGVKATLILKEDNSGKIRGSIRTTNEKVDVAALAKILGGGGHKKAAGFSLDGKLVEKDGHWRIF